MSISTTQIHQIDPTTLLVDLNVRFDARLNPDFIASIREHGVLVPIVAVRTTAGDVRVRMGHRRTLAAVEAGLPAVPVVIASDESTDDAGGIERMVQQYTENEHRAALTTAERGRVAAQLSLLGVSAAQITKRTRMPRKQVDAALIVAKSDLATATSSRYDFLTLDQAVVLAEFDANPGTVEALVAAAQSGRFDHVAQRARDERQDVARREAFDHALRASGLTVVEGSPLLDTTHPLTSLRDAKGGRLTSENHGTCPGHAVYIGVTYGYVDQSTGTEALEQDDDVADDNEDFEDQDPGLEWGQCLTAWPVCTDYADNAHQLPAPRTYGYGNARPKMADLSPELREAARAERRDVIDSNKAWRSAETVRRDWLRTFLTRKTPPQGTAALVSTALALTAETVASLGGNHLAADLLGCDPSGYGRNAGVADLIAKATEPRAQVIGLALVLAAFEDATNTDSWRRADAGTGRYLEFLAMNGYALSDVERRACGQDPASQPTT